MSLDIPDLDWRVQTRTIEQIHTPPRMLQNLVFNQRNTNESDTIEVDIEKNGKKLAPFVTDLEGGKIVKGTTREAKMVKTPRIRLKHPMPAKNLMGQKGPGQIYYAGGITDIMTAKKKKIATEQKNLKDQIANRTEWMCAQALTGVMSVVQDNVSFQVNYLMPSSHKVILVGEEKWSDPKSKPRKQVKQWSQKMINALGFGPTLMICGTDAAEALGDRLEEDKAFDARRISAGEFTWKATSNYMGNLGGIDVYSYGSAYEDDGGLDQNLIPADKMYLIGTQARFTIEFGLILDLAAGAQVVGELFSKAWMKEDPSALWVLAESRPLPVPWQPEAIIEVTVMD
ncbi:MAG: major capsid protein [Desulfobacteraceae bacterium]|nr:major capsid protein [Desulfobacteraceae bacterium]